MWTQIKTALPTTKGSYLVTTKSFFNDPHVQIVNFDGINFYTLENNKITHQVTHWQLPPLPANDEFIEEAEATLYDLIEEKLDFTSDFDYANSILRTIKEDIIKSIISKFNTVEFTKISI